MTQVGEMGDAIVGDIEGAETRVVVKTLDDG